MSMSHTYNLPVMGGHMSTLFGVEASFPELSFRVGWDYERQKPIVEKPDHYGVVSHFLHNRWDDEDGSAHSLKPGQSIASEYKETVEDLRRDPLKRHQQSDVRSVGNYRFIWIRRDGLIRPEQVDEGMGNGVVVFDEQSAEIVRGARLNPYANEWAEKKVLVDLIRAARFSRKEPEKAQAVERRGGKKPGRRKASAAYENKYIEACVKELRDCPAPLSRLHALAKDLGYSKSVSKLGKELEQDPRLAPGRPGCAWSLKDEEVAA